MWLSLVGASLQVWWAIRWDAAKHRLGSKGQLDVAKEHGCAVVMCCHNEGFQLEDWARSIAPSIAVVESHGIAVDITVVNHGSTDATDAVLNGWKTKGWTLIEVPRDRATKKEALTVGIPRSSGEVLVLLDADCRPTSSQWLLHMLSGAGKQWDVLVGTSLPKETERQTSLQRLQRLEARRLAQRAVGAIEAGRPYLAFGRNIALTRTMWNRVGGYQSHLYLNSGDDDLWLQEAVARGARVQACILSAAQTTSEWPRTWRAWQRQKSRHFTASPAYPLPLKIRLMLPGLAWWLLVAGVVHNPSGTSIFLASLALSARTLTFGLFLHRAGQPWRDAWELLLEPGVSVFRVWAWWRTQISDSTTWK